LLTLCIPPREALLFFSLFWAQFVIGAVVPDSFGGLELVGLGVAYLVLGAFVFLRDRTHVKPLIRDGFKTPYRDPRQPGRAAGRSQPPPKPSPRGLPRVPRLRRR